MTEIAMIAGGDEKHSQEIVNPEESYILPVEVNKEKSADTDDMDKDVKNKSERESAAAFLHR
jgi:hypothetical protein